MKRWIHAASKPYKVTRTSLRQATYSKDQEYLTSFCTDKDLAQADEQISKLRAKNAGRIEWYGVPYLNEAQWASDHDLSADALKELELSYIIDTKGHSDIASLSDNESSENTEYVPLSSAIRLTIESILRDLDKYNNRNDVVRGHITMTIFGYGDYSLSYNCDLYCLDQWGTNRNSLSYEFEHDRFTCDYATGCGVTVRDALHNNTAFNRETMPAINRFLAAPISNL